MKRLLIGLLCTVISGDIVSFNTSSASKKVTKKFCDEQIKWYSGEGDRITHSLMLGMDSITYGMTKKKAYLMYKKGEELLAIRCQEAIEAKTTQKQFKKDFQKEMGDVFVRMSTER